MSYKDAFRIMKKVCVKYCGGCNPTYERTEMFQGVQSRFKGQLLFIFQEEPGVERMVFLNGCPKACASDGIRQSLPHYSVTDGNDRGALIDWLQSLIVKGDS